MNEHRTFRNVEVRAVEADGEHFIDLHAITTGVVDDYGSLWMPDVFDEYASKRLPVLCWAHSWSDPLGPGVSYTPGANGPTVRFRFSDFEAVPQARRAFSQVNDGTIRDCSVGFSNTKRRDPTDEEIAQYPGVREVILEAELDEVSLVLRGAVPGAKVVGVRAAGVDAHVPVEFVIDLARKKAAGEITQEDAEAAIELVATKSKPAPVIEPDPVTDPAVLEAAEQEADAALAVLDEL